MSNGTECKTEVTTKSGRFTFYNEQVRGCQAKLKCLERGEILAPITNKEDLDAITGIMNWDCDFYRFFFFLFDNWLLLNDQR